MHKDNCGVFPLYCHEGMYTHACARTRAHTHSHAQSRTQSCSVTADTGADLDMGTETSRLCLTHTHEPLADTCMQTQHTLSRAVDPRSTSDLSSPPQHSPRCRHRHLYTQRHPSVQMTPLRVTDLEDTRAHIPLCSDKAASLSPQTPNKPCVQRYITTNALAFQVFPTSLCWVVPV